MREDVKPEQAEARPPELPFKFLPMTSRPTVLCLTCCQEMKFMAARFHTLHCKDGVATGAIVNGHRRVPERDGSERA